MKEVGLILMELAWWQESQGVEFAVSAAFWGRP
jgi:hypothetical protein